jgi:hypothetical protein
VASLMYTDVSEERSAVIVLALCNAAFPIVRYREKTGSETVMFVRQGVSVL